MFGVLPVLIMGLGLCMLAKNFQFQRNSVAVAGIAVKVRQIRNFGARDIDRYSYQPVSEFRAPKGAVMRGAAAAQGRDTGLPLGSQHPIKVELAAPDAVRVSSAAHWITALGMIGIGAGIAAFGVMALMPAGI